jgi:hypothetical protein
MAAKYAVVFKAFFYDEFVRRRLDHVVRAAPEADVFLVIDETNRAAAVIDYDRVIRITEADVVARGFPNIGERSLFWYNADYPLYYFQCLHPDYAYYVMVEYDAVPNTDIDRLVAGCAAQSVDMAGQSLAITQDNYYWTDSMTRFYERSEMRPYLVCAAVLSRRAIEHLAACRIEQGRGYDLPDASRWPIGECFMATELGHAGFRIADLSSFGRLTKFDWWPPYHETELQDLQDELFVHPVLIGDRYWQSFFKTSLKWALIKMAKQFSKRAWRRLGRSRRRRQSAEFGPDNVIASE